MTSADDHLRAQVTAYLGGEERLEWTLTNRRSGVVREDESTARGRDGDADDEREQVTPRSDLGAVAALTDRRVLFLVGGADGGDDDVMSVPYDEVAGVGTDTDMLARRLVVTTGSVATWRFTVRDSGPLEDAVAYLEDRVAGTDRVNEALERARERREAARTADDRERVAAAYDEAVAAYRHAVDLRTAPAVEGDGDAAALREEVLEAVSAAIESHLDLARSLRSQGNWELGAGNEDTAADLLSEAVAAFDRAHDLATETPPGDPDAIATERDALVDKLDGVDTRKRVARAEDD